LESPAKSPVATSSPTIHSSDDSDSPLPRTSTVKRREIQILDSDNDSPRKRVIRKGLAGHRLSKSDEDPGSDGLDEESKSTRDTLYNSSRHSRSADILHSRFRDSKRSQFSLTLEKLKSG
jgi:hypothetical protein